MVRVPVEPSDSESEDEEDDAEARKAEEKRLFKEKFDAIMAQPLRQIDHELKVDLTLEVPERQSVVRAQIRRSALPLLLLSSAAASPALVR